jgi:hypothetical protein
MILIVERSLNGITNDLVLSSAFADGQAFRDDIMRQGLGLQSSLARFLGLAQDSNFTVDLRPISTVDMNRILKS